MKLFLIILLLAIGFVLIIKGGDFFVTSAVWIAKKTKMPQILIGATVVSIGTTLPEIIVSITAAAKGQNGMALGNAVGSIFCNLALILGLTILLKPAKVNRNAYTKKFAVNFALLILMLVFILNDNLAIWESIILFSVFFIFMFINVYEAIRENKAQKNSPLLQMAAKPASAAKNIRAYVALAQKSPPYTALFKQPAPAAVSVSAAANSSAAPAAASVTAAAATAALPVFTSKTAPKSDEKAHWMKKLEKYPLAMIAMFLVGAAGIAFGANLLVDNVCILAVDYLGIQIEVVSYTVVAFGTSLPEFITALTSIKKKSAGLSFGNIIGANIINGSLLLGICGILNGAGGLIVDDRLALIVGIAAVIVLTAMLIATVLIKQKTYRWQGIVMVASYLGYVVMLVVRVFM